MQKYLKIFCVLLCFFLICNKSFGYDFKKLNPFKKKEEPPKAKMVETKQEWLIEAQNIPLEEREFKKVEEPTTNKQYYYPAPHYSFEKYNYPAGKRELNIEDVKHNLRSYPYIVTDTKCKYAAYPRYYFYPESNQISSNFYVEKLDTSKTRINRILEFNPSAKERSPIIHSGTKERYPNLYNGLTLVDWNKGGDKLLIKEKVGSTARGIYKTYLYVHFMETDIENSYTIKLTDFDDAIKDYFIDFQNLQLVKYSYDIEPLGFSADDDNLIVSLLYVYNNKNEKLFLGAYGYNLDTNETLLLSRTETVFSISANGLILKRTLE